MNTGQISHWTPALAAAELPVGSKKVIKIEERQILLLHTDKGYFACNNRCPHEGFPLQEGHITEGCILTCNWHNWKFDIANGDTLIGGDRLRRYPVRLNADVIEVDMAPLPSAERIAEALDNLKDSFRRHEYDRMARAIGRLQLAGAEPMEAVNHALIWTHERLEFGMTHAHATAADWLALKDRQSGNGAQALVPILEIVGHLAWDSLREFHYPFTATPAATFDADALLQAIEAEDETRAIEQSLAALASDSGFEALIPPLAHAALAHYADFGHSAIYVYKASQLSRHLNDDGKRALALVLVRSLVYAFREDLIPEFRDYAKILSNWTDQAAEPVEWQNFIGKNARAAMRLAGQSTADPQALFNALFQAAVWNMLHFDLSWSYATDGTIQDNVNWLDCTHAITYANAGRQLAERDPTLWPAVLLQMACFAGRNARYTDAGLKTDSFYVRDPLAYYEDRLAWVVDHGEFEYIVSCHYVKLLTAAREETLATPQAEWAGMLAAAINRFLQSGIKRKHTLRTAGQALAFVARE